MISLHDQHDMRTITIDGSDAHEVASKREQQAEGIIIASHQVQYRNTIVAQDQCTV